MSVPLKNVPRIDLVFHIAQTVVQSVCKHDPAAGLELRQIVDHLVI